MAIVIVEAELLRFHLVEFVAKLERNAIELVF
jgi:hypothetical protein